MRTEIAGIFFAFGISALITIVIVVVIWQWFATRRANAVIAREEAYQRLAEQSAAAQKRIAEEIGEVRARVASVEKMLREVE